MNTTYVIYNSVRAAGQLTWDVFVCLYGNPIQNAYSVFDSTLTIDILYAYTTVHDIQVTLIVNITEYINPIQNAYSGFEARPNTLTWISSQIDRKCYFDLI